MRSTIEVFRHGQWIPAAEFEPVGPSPYTATFEYRVDYVFSDDPVPVSLALPVTTDRVGFDADGGAPPCPAFLLDLVPQGRGRKYLAQELKIADGEQQDLLFAQHGAFNPIGNLRLDTAAQFYRERTAAHPPVHEGFSLDEIVTRQEDFLEHIWLHAMLTAGTTGVQGAAPKFLLTQDADDRWFADASIPDDISVKHWLVKLPRGSHETDYAVLHNEAAYLRTAQRCDIRTEGEPQMHGDMLFVRRFDRIVDATGLHRLHQESLASLANLRGFGISASLFDLLDAFRPHVTDPVAEAAEFMKRDILNLAMRNTDNHARNTAVQRLPNGVVQLTPLFDFAPMYMDREFITRGCRWRRGGTELTDWEEIVRATAFNEVEQEAIMGKLAAFRPRVEALPEIMRECGVVPEIIEACRRNIDAQAEQLARLAARHPNITRKPTHGPTP